MILFLIKKYREAFGVLLIAITLVSCSVREKGYTITGQINGDEEVLQNSRIYMRLANARNVIYDSAELKNGKFIFKGQLTTPEKYLLSVKGLPHSIPILLENDRYTVEAESKALGNASIKGGESQQMHNSFMQKNKDIAKKYDLDRLMQYLSNEDTDYQKNPKVAEAIEKANSEMRRVIDSLIALNPLSFYSLLNLYETVQVREYEEAKGRTDEFERSNLYNQSRYLKRVKEIIAKRESLLPGKIAPDLQLLNSKGDTLQLGEILSRKERSLIIFWASWNIEALRFIEMCKEIESLKLNDKAQIITIAVNDNEENWHKVIKERPIKRADFIEASVNTAIEKFNINVIPKLYLVDASGTILLSDIPLSSALSNIDAYFK